MRLVTIVEGHGDYEAAPILIRRILYELLAVSNIEVLRPIRIPRSKLLRSGELERAVRLGRAMTSDGDVVLVLIDANSDCPAELAPKLLTRASSVASDRQTRVVLAKREFEAWFIAGAPSLSGRRGLPAGLTAPSDVEVIADAKGWLSSLMAVNKTYRETLDQAALSALVDLNLARNAPSFDKLVRVLSSIF